MASLSMFKISGKIKQAKLQWLIYRSQTDSDDIKSRMHATSGHFSNETGNI